MSNDFYTFSEYMKKEDNSLTASMEDYLEMIYRLSQNTGFTRIHELSHALNVQPPSATNMVKKLSEVKLLKYEKYGVVILENEGKILGEALLRRHKIIEEFLKIIGASEEEILEQTEKIEHTMSSSTVKCLENYINFIRKNPEIGESFKSYCKEEEK